MLTEIKSTNAVWFYLYVELKKQTMTTNPKVRDRGQIGGFLRQGVGNEHNV